LLGQQQSHSGFRLKKWIEETLVRGYQDPKQPWKNKVWILGIQANALGYQSKELVP
jgi:hypothetical protein